MWLRREKENKDKRIDNQTRCKRRVSLGCFPIDFSTARDWQTEPGAISQSARREAISARQYKRGFAGRARSRVWAVGSTLLWLFDPILCLRFSSCLERIVTTESANQILDILVGTLVYFLFHFLHQIRWGRTQKSSGWKHAVGHHDKCLDRVDLQTRLLKGMFHTCIAHMIVLNFDTGGF